jgi:hypothetical protein
LMPANRGSAVAARSLLDNWLMPVLVQPNVTPLLVVGYMVFAASTELSPGGSVTNPWVPRKSKPACQGCEDEVMVRLTVVVCVMPPPLAVTVMGEVPVAAEEPTAMVIVELPAPPEIDVGLKLTATPLGAPEADNEIAELNPPMLVVVIVDVPELPVATLTAVGETDTVKSLDAVIVRLAVVVCVIPPPVAVTVMG